MVVFTCQNCGESLQKPKVEKHIQFVCRGSPLLTCVDCLKDFRDSEYVSHTQCVTELERYSAKGFTPKPNSQKGLTKQILWNDMINEVLKHKNLGVSESRLLQSICMLPNIPRKQSKFQNFMKNTTGCSCSSADAVFKLLETEWRKFTKDKECIDMSVLSSKKSEHSNNSEKKDVPEAQRISVNQLANEYSEGESKDKTLYHPSEDVKLSKKEKKQKRKREKYLAEINSVENNKNLEFEVRNTNSCKKLKKRRKLCEEDVIEENVNEEVKEELSDDVLVKKKKRRHIESGHENMQTNTFKKSKKLQPYGIDCMELGDRKEVKGKNETAFSWSDIIIEVLQSRTDRELSLKRLCKKVLAEYQAVKGDELYESYEKLVAKFYKKVNKTIGVKVIKDKAKLMTQNIL